jgi:monothiol glutaredoxin
MRDVHTEIDQLVKSKPVVLFMKGTASFPMCGFSARTVEALKLCGQPFDTVNVLEDPEIREGIKQYGRWPTIPQLYVGGNLVGGCDITIELYQAGELQRMIAAASAS